MSNSSYHKLLKQKFGFAEFREKQLEIIKNIVENKRDVSATMFTGAGKSLCFQFPPLYTKKIALIISPLIALMNDQKEKMDKLGISATCLNGTVNNKGELQEDIINNSSDYTLIYITPEYLETETSQDFLMDLANNDLLCLICIDESHCLSSWGHDFRPSYRKLKVLKKLLPDIPILAVTATATQRVQNDIIKLLKLKDPLIIKTTFDRPNLYIELKPKSKPLNDLLHLLEDCEPTIIYCQTRVMTDKITKLLSDNGIKCDAYHAGMHMFERDITYDNFINNKINCIVATVAFGMGIDKTIRKVIHYGTPQDLESYYQEIGRAGRDHKNSYCYLFYSSGDFATNNFLINKINNPIYKAHKFQTQSIMKKYIYTEGCRRAYILHYFGEEYDNDNCGNCDNCLEDKTNKPKVNFTQPAQIFLEVLKETNNKYGSSTIINILRGSNAKKAKKYANLKQYGKGENQSAEWWKCFIRLMINYSFVLEKPVSKGFGFTLHRTVKGRKWLLSKTPLIATVPENMLQFYNNDKDNIIKKTKKTKSNNTVMVTYKLFKDGKTIKDIAEERDLSTKTISEHLCAAYANGLKLDMEKLGFTDDIYKLISEKVLELNCPKRLREIKDELPRKISYLQIKLTIKRMEKEKLI